MVPGILWIGHNTKGKQQFLEEGCVSAKGEAILSDDDDDCVDSHPLRNNVVIAFGTLSSSLT